MSEQPKPTEPIKLPEKTRITLMDLYRNQQQAESAFQQAVAITMDLLGLNVANNNHLNIATGIVTPGTKPDEPTPIRSDVAQSV